MAAVNSLLLLLVIVIGHLSAQGPSPIIDVCVQKSPCLCEYNNGEFVDLFLLNNQNDTEPRFKDQQAEGLGTAKYSWNPCTPYSEGECQNVTMCEKISGPTPKYVTIGTVDTAVFDHDTTTGDLQLQYFSYGEENRTAIIKLICDHDQDGQFIVNGEEPAGSLLYYFELHSKHVCRTSYAPEISSPTSGMSAGTVVAIVLVALLATYLFGGMVYQKCNGAEGKEIIPNYSFWALIGTSIKNGFVYVFTCGKSEYQEIEEKQRINQAPKI